MATPLTNAIPGPTNQTTSQSIPNMNSSNNTNPMITAGLILPLVLRPALNKLIKDGNSQYIKSSMEPCISALDNSFIQMENVKPGFSYDFLRILLRNAVVSTTSNTSSSNEFPQPINLETTNILVDNELQESILRLAATTPIINSSTDNKNKYGNFAFLNDLNQRATELKVVLSKIPDQIRDRKIFLETIKEIAGAIKRLLDTVNEVYLHIGSNPSKFKQLDETQKQKIQGMIEQKKREFVRYSKKFSNTLKDYFREGDAYAVFRSANSLVFQADLIATTIKDQIVSHIR